MSRLRFQRRWPLLLCLLLLGAGLLGTITHAELTEEQKRQLFLKAREKMRTVATPTPEKSATPRSKPKPAAHPPVKKKKKPTPEPEEEKPARTPRAKPEATRTPRPEPEETPRRRPTPEESTPPRTSVTKSKKTEPPANQESAEVVVKKSGYQKPRGFSLPFHLFGKRYKYLSNDVRKQIDRAPVLRERWRFIIVHNSGTRQGNARIFDYYHKNVRRMRNGLAYHFVIGNGTSSGNGEVEVGDRWRRQINGGHVHSDYLNNISLGICLVGDFNRDQPTRAQLEASDELIRYLRDRCGKVERHEIPVRPHREMNPPRWGTDCPGDDFPYRWFGQFR
ncbi:MAG: peptidoglycan recognition family protein [Chthoniobacterales bacterium]